MEKASGNTAKVSSKIDKEPVSDNILTRIIF